jgi:hypothetical protein
LRLLVNIYQVLGTAIAESVGSVGTAFQMFNGSAPRQVAGGARSGWLDQFSDASLNQRAARRTVDALYRGATVRL